MLHLRRSSAVGVVLGALLFWGNPTLRADTITSANLSYTAGMYQNPGTFGVTGAYYGLLGDTGIGTPPSPTGIGLQNNTTFFDGFAGSSLARDAYGVKAGSFAGYVDLQNPFTSPGKYGGVLNIAPGTYVNNGTSATVTTFLTNSAGTGRVLMITQVFSFLGPGNVLKDTVTLTNVTALAGGIGATDLPVQFRRVDSMYVNNGIGQPNNIVTVDPTGNPVTSAAPYSFVPPTVTNPPLGDSESPNPAFPLIAATNGGTVNDPSHFLGGAFNLDLGTLTAFPLPGLPDTRTKTFNTFFADGLTGQSESDLRAELNGLGFNYIISDRSNSNVQGGPFVAAIGTQVVPGIPEPTTLALLGLGLAGLAGARWRRSRSK